MNEMDSLSQAVEMLDLDKIEERIVTVGMDFGAEGMSRVMLCTTGRELGKSRLLMYSWEEYKREHEAQLKEGECVMWFDEVNFCERLERIHEAGIARSKLKKEAPPTIKPKGAQWKRERHNFGKRV